MYQEQRIFYKHQGLETFMCGYPFDFAESFSSKLFNCKENLAQHGEFNSFRSRKGK